MSKVLSASICLRRDNEFNYDKVKDTFIPLNGEICLVDTAYGIKAKIGNGFNSYGSLPWIEEQALLGIVIQGYLKDNEFYLDNNYTIKAEKNSSTIYINRTLNEFLFYDEENDIFISNNISVPLASDTTPGILKLYSTIGENADGTMTQVAITAQLKKKLEISIDKTNEQAILTGEVQPL